MWNVLKYMCLIPKLNFFTMSLGDCLHAYRYLKCTSEERPRECSDALNYSSDIVSLSVWKQHLLYLSHKICLIEFKRLFTSV